MRETLGFWIVFQLAGSAKSQSIFIVHTPTHAKEGGTEKIGWQVERKEREKSNEFGGGYDVTCERDSWILDCFSTYWFG